jgi:hypothetical protein
LSKSNSTSAARLDADLGRGLLDVQRLGLAGHLDRLATEIDNREPQILDREVEIGHSGNKIDNSDVEVGGAAGDVARRLRLGVAAICGQRQQCCGDQRSSHAPDPLNGRSARRPSG